MCFFLWRVRFGRNIHVPLIRTRQIIRHRATSTFINIKLNVCKEWGAVFTHGNANGLLQYHKISSIRIQYIFNILFVRISARGYSVYLIHFLSASVFLYDIRGSFKKSSSLRTMVVQSKRQTFQKSSSNPIHYQIQRTKRSNT